MAIKRGNDRKHDLFAPIYGCISVPTGECANDDTDMDFMGETLKKADCIERDIREGRETYVGDMSGISFNPDDGYHRISNDCFVIWIPDDPVHKLFWFAALHSMGTVSMCPDGIVAMEAVKGHDLPSAHNMLLLMAYLNDNASMFFAKS